jgi:uncharacterized protein (TIGR02996 family)
VALSGPTDLEHSNPGLRPGLTETAFQAENTKKILHGVPSPGCSPGTIYQTKSDSPKNPQMDDTSFIEAILAAPDDDSLRLIYADWLEERGDIRAEYLRLLHQQWQIPLRLAELRNQLDPAWLANVSQWRVVITIDGRDFSTLAGFIGTLGRAIYGEDHQDTANLDWLNDILAWRRGELMSTYTLVWRNSEESRQRLGHAETVREMEKRNQQQFPFGHCKAVSNIDEARRGEGPTVFDWIMESIERNKKYVRLRLE